MLFTIDRKTWRSPNHSSRNGVAITAIIIHSCEGTPCGNEDNSSLPWLCNPSSGVSCHYYITREGQIYQLVDDNRQAWHAGESQLDGVWYCNAYSLGIELSHRDNCAPYPQIQAEALTWLCRNLIATYAIPKNAVATHRQVAEPAGRKVDPTDWTDADFAVWRTSLYITDPLRARTIPGPPGQPPKYCSIPVAQYYAAKGGLGLFGYPLVDEFKAAYGPQRKPCAILACERATIKESPDFGVELALNSEAKVEGWLL